MRVKKSRRRILFLSDLHWVGHGSIVQENILNWVRQVIVEQSPDIIVFGGDMLQRNEKESFDSLWSRISWIARNHECYWLPGNRDALSQTLLEPCGMSKLVVQGADLIGEDSFRLALLNSEDRAAACKDIDKWPRFSSMSGSIVMFGHRRPELGERLEQLLSDGEKTCTRKVCIFGHGHQAIDEIAGQWRIIASAGLDPSRTVGSPPDVLLIKIDENDVAIERLVITTGYLWSKRRRMIIPGIAPRASLEKLFDRAIHESITAVQVSPMCVIEQLDSKGMTALEKWRKNADAPFLSLHLPDPNLKTDEKFGGLESCLEWGRIAGVNDYTIHLPFIPADELFDKDRGMTSEVATRILELYTGFASQAIEGGSRLSIENNHNITEHAQGGVADLLSTRPWHLEIFIEAIRERLISLGYSEQETRMAGVNFDSAHARNNGLVSKEIAPSEWISNLGRYIQTMHIHQVIKTAKGLKNHQPINSLRGPLINYEGLLAVLASTPGPDCYAFVEVRDLDEAVRSWQTIMQLKRQIMS